MFKNIQEVLNRASQPITAPFPSVEEKKRAKKEKISEYQDGWFNMKPTKMTPELERDLKLLSMRNALDPHHHYKKGDNFAKTKKPVQVGTIIEGAGEFYSGRLTRKERKSTLVDAIISEEQKRSHFRSKYLKLQQKNQSGDRKHYHQQRNKRLLAGSKGKVIKQEKYK